MPLGTITPRIKGGFNENRRLSGMARVRGWSWRRRAKAYKTERVPNEKGEKETIGATGGAPAMTA